MWLFVLIVILGACGAPDAATDGGDANASSGAVVTALPGETSPIDRSAAGEDPAEEGPRDAVTNEAESAGSERLDRPETGDDVSMVVTGAARLAAEDFSRFSGLRVGLIANRASVVNGQSVIDLLAAAPGVDLVAIFAPEHGLRADADAGEFVADGIDPITGLPVYSLFGATKTPPPESLAELDILVYDLQDVGARFYTYTATMGLAMQAAADADLPFVILDRPNPLGNKPAGSMRTPDQDSFVSQYPIPSLHGMTAGELALAIKGEGWLDGLDGLDLQVEQVDGWRPDHPWDRTGLPWVPPSPGLPTSQAALAYPSTVLFEATTLSYGRGTDHPFQQIGAPWLDGEALAGALEARSLAGVSIEPVRFTPTADESAPEPQYDGIELSGVRIMVTDGLAADQAAVGVHLLAAVLAQADQLNTDPNRGERPIEVIDRPDFLDLLTGTTEVRLGLQDGLPAVDIVASWTPDLDRFETIRRRYSLYRR